LVAHAAGGMNWIELNSVGHPAVAEKRGASIAVLQDQHRRVAPRVGEIVDLVVQRRFAGSLEDGHQGLRYG